LMRGAPDRDAVGGSAEFTFLHEIGLRAPGSRSHLLIEDAYGIPGAKGPRL
jgi:hypothetical protein